MISYTEENLSRLLLLEEKNNENCLYIEQKATRQKGKGRAKKTAEGKKVIIQLSKIPPWALQLCVW